MFPKETTNLAILSFLELPSIGRKTVYNFLLNFNKRKSIDEFSNSEFFNSQIISTIPEYGKKINENNVTPKELEFVNHEVKENISRILDNSRHSLKNLNESVNLSQDSFWDCNEIIFEKFKNYGQNFKVTKDDWIAASNTAKKIIDFSEKLDIKIVNYFDEKYPTKLRNIPDPPVILFYKGNIEFLSKNILIAVVGTREPTEYGIRAAGTIGELFANCKIPVVSGLAEGCDAYAQQGCVNKNGQTVAVLAHGLDRIYPKQNENLAHEILSKNGCLLSEYAPGIRASKFSFVDRDRLQSGLSDAVIVVETGVKGGTMHTVNFCIKQNRVLGCISHPPNYLTLPQSAGNQMLIAEKKAIPINIDYFNEGMFNQIEYENSILKFLKNTFEKKKIDHSEYLQIVEKFHEYVFKRKVSHDFYPQFKEINSLKQDIKKSRGNGKKLKEKTPSQKNLFEGDNVLL
jgi:DNA processing protein